MFLSIAGNVWRIKEPFMVICAVTGSFKIEFIGITLVNKTI